jgi:hypothetical protein
VNNGDVHLDFTVTIVEPRRSDRGRSPAADPEILSRIDASVHMWLSIISLAD